MTDRCPKCGRPVMVYPSDRWPAPDECGVEDAVTCRAYRAGLIAGVELAKARAFPDIIDLKETVNWSDVDRELTERIGK